MSKNYKVIMVGDASTGKTSLLNQYVYNEFQSDTTSTIGIEFCHKNIDRETKITFWDTSGQEQFQSMMSSYYRGAHAVIFVFDVSNRQSFVSLEKWWRQYHAYGNTQRSIAIVVGNKCDLMREVTIEEARAWAVHKGFMYEEVSAKDNANIDPAFETAIRQMHQLPEVQTETVRLKAEPKSDRCCF